MYNYLYFDNHNNMKTLSKNKYIILIPIIILNIISIIYLSSTPYINKHLIYLSISYILLFITSKINFKFILKFINILYLLSLLLLTIVLIIGKEINGSKAWLHIAGISIQPSEITKLILSIYLPYLIIKKKNIFYIALITIIPSILTFLEPDTGAIIFYIIIFLSTLKFTKIKKKPLLIVSTIISIFLLLNIYLYFINKDILINIYGTNIFYRIDRLISFKEQNNIQTTNSLISIGAKKLIYIPENHNDFIFSAIISKYPLSFPFIILSYLFILLYYIKKITNKKNISNIINFIILNTLIFQTFYNIFMNLSIVPIIGIPLPFISYGGSYLVTLYTLIGISINNSKVV